MDALAVRTRLILAAVAFAIAVACSSTTAATVDIVARATNVKLPRALLVALVTFCKASMLAAGVTAVRCFLQFATSFGVLVCQDAETLAKRTWRILAKSTLAIAVANSRTRPATVVVVQEANVTSRCAADCRLCD